MDTGMPMPALVSLMPMPSYANAKLLRNIVICFVSIIIFLWNTPEIF
jgi:hypothetical protein